MLTEKEMLNLMQSYNIKSDNYGPTLYKNEDKIGLCIEIKDSLFGYLTRLFPFETLDEASLFLKQLFWYKNNHKKYNITLELDNYNNETPKIIYKLKSKILEPHEMLNIEEEIKKKEQEKQEQALEQQQKNVYIAHIKALNNYLIKRLEEKEKAKKEKNDLKVLENDLKFELLEELGTYYEKTSKFTKKEITLEPLIPNQELTELKNSKPDLENLTEEELKEILKKLVIKIKEEELDEKHLVNIYSNSIYAYNISILRKQIDFVKSKIEAEKNFNLKGSKIHNIDEELKSFLKTNRTPKKIQDFISENKEQITNKLNQIPSDLEAYYYLCGTPLELPKIKLDDGEIPESNLTDLDNDFDNLDEKTKAYLTLYNSFYKQICNEIINNNLTKEELYSKDLTYLYNELEEIVYNESNSHYLNKYFKYINFKTKEKYIDSILDICNTLNNTRFHLNGIYKVFYKEENNKYKALYLKPILNETESITILDLNNQDIIYIPDKIILDEETKELSTITTKNIYITNNINQTLDSITLNMYNKIKKKEKNITITTSLKLDKQIIFNIGNIEV